MKKYILLSSLLACFTVSAQNFEPSRQTVRLDLGVNLYSGINTAGIYQSVNYEYAFLDHVAAEAFFNSSLHHSSSINGTFGSRMGTGLSLIGRLYGLKNGYDVKLIGGVRYGTHFHADLTEVPGGGTLATRNYRRSGFSPVFGAGYEQRLGDWLLSLEYRTSFEPNGLTYNSLSLGLGYRF